ncbi:MAG: CinA family protein [Micavibrio aeruginosavorus]|uniref:CinA family protein n=1 Tax=Micavibrio aeruginosavorus TaxID=349221 RepID=A0A7T5R0T1_9BACT|nr:MAG: CinA family protein [Micavibrio aeruginosavorus]
MQDLVESLSVKMQALGLMLTTAESCTGGMIAMAMTERPGSSAIFERGFITYSNQSKHELLDVPKDTLLKHGAVSAQVATAMVRGALVHSRAEIALSVTGIAGPDGGSDKKPVGLVYIGFGDKSGLTEVAEHRFQGNRAEVRKQAAEAALKHLIRFIDRLP